MDSTNWQVDALDELRAQIDEIDKRLIGCLAERMALSSEIGLHKLLLSTEVEQPQRARVVRDNYTRVGKTLGLHHDFLDRLYGMVHAESCRMQLETLDNNGTQRGTMEPGGG